MTTPTRSINRRAFLRSGAGWATAMAGPLAFGQQAQPNIVFILADDMGYGDPRCYNPQSKIPTPNMDRLAKEGMRFTDAHSPSAVCSPTRYGILTGRYAWRTRMKSGVLSGFSPALIEKDRLTVAGLLKQRGYYTAGVGKWHLGLDWAAKKKPHDGDLEAPNFGKPEGLEVDYTRPIQDAPVHHGFDYYYGIPASLDMAPYVYIENDRVTEQPTARTEGIRDGGVFWRAGEKGPSFDFTDVLPNLTRKAVSLIEEHGTKRKTQPLFLYFALTGPHTPWMPVKEVEGKSGAGKYGDFTHQVDQTVGAVMQAIDRAGLARNTLLIVTSDNGSDWRPEHIEEFGHLSNYILRGRKRDTWEGGHRVPFLARWPVVVKSGTSNDQPICLIDLMATAAELSGQAPPKNAGGDSDSFAPLLRGQPRPAGARDAMVLHSADGMFVLRQGKWKYIEGQGPGSANYGKWPEVTGAAPAQLYDLSTDIREARNLYFEHPGIVKRVKALLDTYRKQGHSRSS